jgi:hypothetical protein
MILLTSGAYINSGLIAEFGKLPPCMLPLQNKRLYQHQCTLFEKDLIFMSLPMDYELTEYDKINFDRLYITPLKVPLGLSLGESIVYALNLAGRYSEPLKILHGDTLINEIPQEYDCCLYGEAEEEYKWLYLSDIKENDVYIGYFSFSDQVLLIRKIIESMYDFEKGVILYDNSINLKHIKTKSWLDFGMVSSYYRSKTRFTTQREFNDLKISKYSVTKYSKQIKKIEAEAHWFNSIPPRMKKYVPTVWNYGITDDTKGFYEIEYYYLSSLAELYIFGNSSLLLWKNILALCLEYIEQASEFPIMDKNEIIIKTNWDYKQKTEQRMNEFIKNMNIDLEHTWILNDRKIPSLREIIHDTNHAVSPIRVYDIGIMHGDFCFSNILYNYINQSIKIIDPRGTDFNETETIYGDIRYDIAKLAHSILGLYDFIISGNFSLREVGPYSLSFRIYLNNTVTNVQRYFKEMRFLGRTINELSVYPIMINLFLSMLPLHKDNPLKQKAFLANAFRLYLEYQEGIIT